MAFVPVKLQSVDRHRLTHILRHGRAVDPHDLQVATFWAERRSGGESVGCLIGHYVRVSGLDDLSLVPINFKAQVKSPMAAPELWKRYPASSWRHYTLHYQSGETEGWGFNAACLALCMGACDVQRLFWPRDGGDVHAWDRGEALDRLGRYLNNRGSFADDLPLGD